MTSDNVNFYFEGQHHRRKTKTNAHRAFAVNQFTGDSIIPAYGVGLPYIYCSRDGFGLGDEDCDPFAAGDPLNQGFTGTQIMAPGMIAPFDLSADLKYYRGVAEFMRNCRTSCPRDLPTFIFSTADRTATMPGISSSVTQSSLAWPIFEPTSARAR